MQQWVPAKLRMESHAPDKGGPLHGGGSGPLASKTHCRAKQEEEGQREGGERGTDQSRRTVSALWHTRMICLRVLRRCANICGCVWLRSQEEISIKAREGGPHHFSLPGMTLKQFIKQVLTEGSAQDPCLCNTHLHGEVSPTHRPWTIATTREHSRVPTVFAAPLIQ